MKMNTTKSRGNAMTSASKRTTRRSSRMAAAKPHGASTQMAKASGPRYNTARSRRS